MLQTKIDSEKYRSEFVKKFANFCEKSPVLLSFVTSETGVVVIHANTGKQYEFSWDYTVPVKMFIHTIKDILVQNHYPRMIENIENQVPLTPEEQAALLESGTLAENLPTFKTETIQRIWRISKVIVWRDIFILEDEQTGDQFRYKMNKSCVFFLKAYRSNKFTLETAWDYFKTHSVLLNKIELRSFE